jgi:threonine synthase
MPMLIVGSPLAKNPIVMASLRNPLLYLDGDTLAARRAASSEPLISWHAGDGQAALEAIRCTRGFAFHATEKSLLQCAAMLGEMEGLSVSPTSTAGLAALLERHKKEALAPDRYVAIVTGRKTGRVPIAWFQQLR